MTHFIKNVMDAPLIVPGEIKAYDKKEAEVAGFGRGATTQGVMDPGETVECNGPEAEAAAVAFAKQAGEARVELTIE